MLSISSTATTENNDLEGNPSELDGGDVGTSSPAKLDSDAWSRRSRSAGGVAMIIDDVGRLECRVCSLDIKSIGKGWFGSPLMHSRRAAGFSRAMFSSRNQS
jgi:hypothetical protein